MRAGDEDALFGDPSLRVGGKDGISDTLPPTTTARVRRDGESRVEVTFEAIA